jgi:hypothetical protein
LNRAVKLKMAASVLSLRTAKTGSITVPLEHPRGSDRIALVTSPNRKAMLHFQ